ncbi:MAG: tRNA 4-thiouridine(8) synthase ThiI [Lachnospiraceae bacterium]|nr:tRNA 4-thiouridine(8) synthase ThiI [Lachnospiraceae bacterium]
MREQYYQAFLIKYAEIGIKGKNRHLFESALVKQIKNSLKKTDGNFTVRRSNGRIFLEIEGEYSFHDTIAALQTVFGISGICPMVQTDDEGFEKLGVFICDYLRSIFSDISSPPSFKVAARRSRKDYPLDTMQINAQLGSVILAAFPTWYVDVHNPDVMVNVEIREKIYIYSETFPGLGGMPLGMGGKAMLLLSGGIDSPVAGFMVAKRGIKIDAVYFHAPPYTSDRAKQKVVDLAQLVTRYTGTIYLHIINFTDIQCRIYDCCPHEELTIIMRRYMMRIAEHIAKETDCLGLITGESIGQVASQTLQSLAATDEACHLPVYRPLAGFDKIEIIEIAKKIGTFSTSILPYEDCCTIFVAKHPVIKPDINKIKRHEKDIKDIENLVTAALATKELIIMSQRDTPSEI